MVGQSAQISLFGENKSRVARLLDLLFDQMAIYEPNGTLFVIWGDILTFHLPIVEILRWPTQAPGAIIEKNFLEKKKKTRVL